MIKCVRGRKQRKVLFFWCHKRSVFVPSERDVAKLSAKSLGNYAFDILRISNENKAMYEMFKKRINSEIGSFDAKDCYRVLKSLEINNKLNEEEDMTCKYSIKEICDISFLCSKLNLVYIPLYASLSISFLNKINLATPENLSILSLSFCKVQIRDVNLFNRIAIATLNLLYMFDVENLVNVLISLAFLDIKKDMLLYSSVDIFVKNQNKLNGDQLVKIAHVYSKFDFVNKDINSILVGRIPAFVPHLNNVQLAELTISLNRLGVHSYVTDKFVTNVNLSHLAFPIAIKVIKILSSVNRAHSVNHVLSVNSAHSVNRIHRVNCVNHVNVEFKYDQILSCVQNFLLIHGRGNHLNGKVNFDILHDSEKSPHLASDSRSDSKSDSKDDGRNVLLTDVVSNQMAEQGTEGGKPPADEEWGEPFRLGHLTSEYSPIHDVQSRSQFYLPVLERTLNKPNSCGSEMKNHVFSEEELTQHYLWYNLKQKINPNSVCHLNVDLFECLVNFLLQNCVSGYEEKLKYFLNCISREIILSKEYLNFNCLIKIFSALFKTPIIWNLSLLNWSSINSGKGRKKCLFYINEDTDFYEQLVERYFCIFHSSENADNHSLVLCFIMNLLNAEVKNAHSSSIQKCLEHYALVRRKGKDVQVGYPIEDQSVYTFVEYFYKGITLWGESRHLFDTAAEEEADPPEENSPLVYTFPYAMRDSVPNKILTLELFGIVQNFTKNVKMHFKEGAYTISLFEFDNYVVYLFLEPLDFFYSPGQGTELDFLNSVSVRNELREEAHESAGSSDVRNAGEVGTHSLGLPKTQEKSSTPQGQNAQTEKKQLLLICGMSYNPYEIFQNNNYFVKSETLVKINYLLIKGYSIIAIPFYSWRCMSYEEKVGSISALRQSILDGQG
ncbi:hypothetical protein PCYB_081570 [Plasmodium cynomolgi strain B]|uniref:RAP domain-containing protein n=1 Tax=Plasmodium cynomolgi (strain B) TaxID=1120755 RepID=K6UD52_PLACD|nr:hypothetical protein PCYB_081570 [Plasmodium cynomolgi strain B]GAB65996.1 hypothetical protein PCYB_081570 [Plasmodium cynomolgi strain B]